MSQGMGASDWSQGREMCRGQEKEQVRTATRHRERIQDCQNSAERVRNQIREMAQLTQGKAFEAGKGERQRNTLRNEVRNMEEEHTRFMAGLNDQDREQLREHLTVMDRERERVQECMQNMDDEFGKDSPDAAARIQEQTREMERAMNRWEEQYGMIE